MELTKMFIEVKEDAQMTTERREMVEELQYEKKRYEDLIENSRKLLTDVQKTEPGNVELHVAIESEIQMLYRLLSYIEFKLGLLDLREYAS
ncbi:hypothetical protein [Brevibacillus dissolubilis]|uniref:hypothetical protein n=1 Tax=Brevibacillus dissolubilis TaxID=1844116 RepID=UPI001116D9D8|nr:hypothetical protein [Brevibacillus dissolubilis]